MTITLELAAILFLGTVTLYLLSRLGTAVKDVRQYTTQAEVLQYSLVSTYKTLDNVLHSAKDDYPEAVKVIVSDFDNRMRENMAKLEVKRGV